MTKYEPLRTFLQNRKETTWQATFADVENVLGFELPQSAFVHRAWWANEISPKGSHVHAVWINAGWQTEQVDQARNRLTFRRIS